MKKTFLASLLFLGVISQAQVGIKTPDPKSTLDITAHSATAPIFGMKAANGIGSWDNIWFKLDSSAPSINASGAETGLQFNVGRNQTGTYGDNGQILNTVATMTPSGTVGIGTTVPATNALLELSSTTKGFLPTRMTTAQRDAINPKHEGLVVYNLDTHCLQFWNATEWIGNCTNNGGGTNPGTGTITNCTTGALNGTYQAGTAMNSSNTVVINVNVTQVGSLTVTSNTVNGVTFSGTQTFNSTGAQQITLTASGTPTAAGNFNFSFSSGSGSSCTRSITFQSAGGSGGQGTITNCSTTALGGSYQADTAMNSSNTIQMTVNATQTGAWSASSSTVNGVTFSGSGTFTSTGTQTITLTANGTPSAAGNFNFTFTLGSSTCSRNITFTSANGAGTITNCSTTTLSGTYKKGIAMNSGNTIQLTINATQTGTWSASSATVNGVTFSGSGTFNSTGSQNITLTANGTPTNTGDFNYVFTLGSSTCSRTITFDGDTQSSVCQFGSSSGNTYTTSSSNGNKYVSFNVSHDGATGNTGFDGCFSGSPDSIRMDSYWLLGYKGGNNYSSTTTNVTFNRPMNNVVIALAELDANFTTGGTPQNVVITAQDANGNNVPVTLTKTRDCTGNNTISGNTVSQSGTGSGNERNTSLSIRVGGNAYYRSIKIVHNGVKGTYRQETSNATAMNLELCNAVAQ